MTPNFGFTDELRLVFRDRGQVWGGAALFRDGTAGAEHFDEDNVEFLASLSSVMSVGMRAGLLAGFASEPDSVPFGPAVVIVGADGSVQQMSAGADQRLEQLVGSATPLEAAGVITSLVGAARRFARGERDPRHVVRGGGWRSLTVRRVDGRRAVVRGLGTAGGRRRRAGLDSAARWRIRAARDRADSVPGRHARVRYPRVAAPRRLSRGRR